MNQNFLFSSAIGKPFAFYYFYDPGYLTPKQNGVQQGQDDTAHSKGMNGNFKEDPELISSTRVTFPAGTGRIIPFNCWKRRVPMPIPS